MTCTSIDTTQVIDTRRAFGVWFIFFYALYLAILGLAHLHKQEEYRKKFQRFHDEIGYYHYFFIILGLIAHTNTASPVACAFWYVYVAAFGITFFAYFKNHKIIMVVSNAIHLALLFAIWLCIIIDSWWDFYTGRYVFN